MKSHSVEHHSDGCCTYATDSDHPLLRLTDVSMRFGRREVLKNVNLTVNDGDFMAITGPNGGGKTTMLRIILGLIHPTRGKIEYPAPGGRHGIQIGYLPQKNMVDSHFPLLVKEVVASGLLSRRDLSREEIMSKVNDMLQLMGLEEKALSPIGALSGGQLQRTLLGRALVSSPELLVMDEPLSYLDKKFESRLYDIMKELAGKTTVILVSHELSYIDHIANRHILVDCEVRECHASHHYVTSECDEC